MSENVDHSELIMILESKIRLSSTRAVAKTLGFSQTYIWKVARGLKRISPKLAQKLGFKPILGTFQKL